MRPSLDGARGARYLIPAPRQQPARIFLRASVRSPHAQALVAAKLATGFRATSTDDARMVAATAAIRDAANATADVLASTMSARVLDAAVDVAVQLQRAILARPDDAACVGVAVVRRLLDDAPDTCVDLDRAVRDAARLHAGSITAEHEARAASIVAEVTR